MHSTYAATSVWLLLPVWKCADPTHWVHVPILFAAAVSALTWTLYPRCSMRFDRFTSRSLFAILVWMSTTYEYAALVGALYVSSRLAHRTVQPFLYLTFRYFGFWWVMSLLVERPYLQYKELSALYLAHIAWVQGRPDLETWYIVLSSLAFVNSLVYL